MTFPRWSRPLAALLLLLGLAPSLAAADKIGLVLMHGKLSSPSKPFFSELETKLAGRDILVDAPEMPWSANRRYDKSYEQAMEEIAASIKRLRDRGASKVVVGGHSMGAAAALIYGARHPVDGLLLLAPGHHPQSNSLRGRFAESVARARALAAAGKGDDKEEFNDFDASQTPPAFTISTTPRIYLSYFDPDGIANTLVAAGKIPATVPVLWVDGTNENPGLKGYGQKVYAAIGSSASQHVEVTATHVTVLRDSSAEVLAWLGGLKKYPATRAGRGRYNARPCRPALT